MICRNMNEREVEQKNACNPSIESSIRLKIWIVEHILDILGFDFNIKVFDTSEMKTAEAKCTIKSKKF
jgi:hypothetical protein